MAGHGPVEAECREPAPLIGVLLCCCSVIVISPPAFMIVFLSQRWNRHVMWLMAGFPFVMTWFAILCSGSHGQFSVQEALYGVRVTLQPLVMLPFLLPMLAEVAYQLKQAGIPARG